MPSRFIFQINAGPRCHEGPAFIWRPKLAWALYSWSNGFYSLIFTGINRSVISVACYTNKYLSGLFQTSPWRPGVYSKPGVYRVSTVICEFSQYSRTTLKFYCHNHTLSKATSTLIRLKTAFSSRKRKNVYVHIYRVVSMSTLLRRACYRDHMAVVCDVSFFKKFRFRRPY